MAVIKVILGGCGIKQVDANGTTRHILKTPEDGPFEYDDALADYLVRKGVAEYVTKPAQHEKINAAYISRSEAQGDAQSEGSQEPGKIVGHLEPADLELMSYAALKQLAAELGVTPNGQKKADYVAAIAAVEVETDADAIVDDFEDDELPDLSAADPE